MAYQIEKLLKDNGDKVPADVKSNLEAKITDLRTAINEKNIGKIKIITEELKQESMKMGEEMYKNSGNSQDGSDNPQGGSDNGDNISYEKP